MRSARPREDIFLDDVDRQELLKTLAEGCLKGVKPEIGTRTVRTEQAAPRPIAAANLRFRPPLRHQIYPIEARRRGADGIRCGGRRAGCHHRRREIVPIGRAHVVAALKHVIAIGHRAPDDREDAARQGYRLDHGRRRVG